MSSPKVVVRTGYKLSLNNIDRCKIYNKNDIKYVDGIIDYFKDDKKRVMNMIDYFTGKIKKHDEINLIDENGNYFTKENIDKRKRYINKQFNNSNVWQIVLSIDKNLVDQNISWRELEKKLATEILPKTFKKMGFVNSKNMCYQFSLHTNTRHPHFHISFMEKCPNTKSYDSNKLIYRRSGKIPQDVIKYLKNETVLAIEREGKFRPMSVEVNKDIDELKKYFNPKEKNFVLYDKEDILLEEKILNLGKLLNERDISYNSKIKFNSIKDKEIINLTKEIKKDLFKSNKDLKISLSSFNDSVNRMSSYLTEVSKGNKIKKEDIDLSYINNKETYLNNYILNSIVNHARYNYKTKTNLFNTSDVIQMIILDNYRKRKTYSKKDIVKSSLINTGTNKYQNRRDIRNAIKNINNEMEQAAEEFSKLFQTNEITK
jgi:hypothetical protein